MTKRVGLYPGKNRMGTKSPSNIMTNNTDKNTERRDTPATSHEPSATVKDLVDDAELPIS